VSVEKYLETCGQRGHEVVCALIGRVCSDWSVLTDAGDEVIEPLLGEQRVLQAPEVKLQHSSHRVDVVVALLVNQRVVTWTTAKSESATPPLPHPTLSVTRPPRRTLLTSLEGVLDVVDLHLRARHPEYALMLEACWEQRAFVSPGPPDKNTPPPNMPPADTVMSS